MPVGTANGDMGLMGNIKLNIDEKTGHMKASSDVFADAVDEMYQAAKLPAEKKEAEIKVINTKLEALSSLQSKVTEFANKSSHLFHTDAYGNTGVFSNLYANFSSTSDTPIGDLMNLNVAVESNLEEFTLEIEQVASHDSTTSTTGQADTTSDLNWSGNLTINGQDIAITNNMSLEDVKTMVNSYTNDTGVKATILKVGDVDYRLSFQAADMASPITIADTLIGPAGGSIPAATGKTAEDLSAKIKFNGISLVRNSNTINDIVEGLTVIAKKAEPGTVMTVRLSPDEESTKEAINSWVTALNDVIDEVEKHKAYDLDKQELNEESILYNTTVLSSVDGMVKNGLSWVVSGVGDNDYNILDQIGIKLNTKTGKYYVDDQVLDEQVKNNFEGVRKVFEYQEEINNNSFAITSHPSSIPSSIIADSSGNQLTTTVTLNKDGSGNISADVTISGGDYAAHTFTVPTEAITVKNGVAEFSGIDAVSGTTTDLPYKGFSFVYIGTDNIANSSSDSTTIKMTQGYADRFAGNITTLLEENTGVFADQKKTFSEKITDLEAGIERVLARADREREKYEKQFAQLEAVRQALLPLQMMAEAFSNMMASK